MVLLIQDFLTKVHRFIIIPVILIHHLHHLLTPMLTIRQCFLHKCLRKLLLLITRQLFPLCTYKDIRKKLLSHLLYITNQIHIFKLLYTLQRISSFLKVQEANGLSYCSNTCVKEYLESEDEAIFGTVVGLFVLCEDNEQVLCKIKCVYPGF